MLERIWTKFLSKSDLELLERAPRRPVGHGKRAAVLCIDLYKGVFGTERVPLLEGVARWPGYCGPQAWDAIAPIRALQNAAREQGTPVVHVTGLSAKESGVVGWYEAIHTNSTSPLKRSFGMSEQDRFEIVDELAPLPGEILLRKASPSAFCGTLLLSALNHLDIDTLFVVGEATSGCVRATVVDAASYRFKVQVVEECVFDRCESSHAMNLFDMHQKYADVISTEDAAALLRTMNEQNGV